MEFSTVQLLVLKYTFSSETICNVICDLPDQNIFMRCTSVLQ